ncbi:MAG: hypothetical protein KIT68_07905, partial [Phycisphaeraceae bacterium]|nr:hypothetical protein [Phycisphaeraceae bacterium]
MRFPHAFGALTLLVGLIGQQSFGAEASVPAEAQVRRLAGTVRVERFVLSAAQVGQITDDVVIESETDIIIDGPLNVEAPGLARQNAPNVTLRAARRILIGNAIGAADGAAGNGGIRAGNGTSIEIEAPLIVAHVAEIRAGRGARGLAAAGGDGGSVIVRGRLVNASGAVNTVLRAGNGGAGDEGGHRGGNGGDALLEPLAPGGGGWLPLSLTLAADYSVQPNGYPTAPSGQSGGNGTDADGANGANGEPGAACAAGGAGKGGVMAIAGKGGNGGRGQNGQPGMNENGGHGGPGGNGGIAKAGNGGHGGRG